MVNVIELPLGLSELVEDFTGEKPQVFGSSFNLHYVTSNTFIKVTRAWVKPFRFNTEVNTAGYLAGLKFPVAKPLTPMPLNFVDENGFNRYVSIWERLTPARKLEREEGTKLAADWITRLWQVEAPTNASAFQLDDFLHGVHVRLDNSTDSLAPKILAGVEEVVAQIYSMPIVDYGFIHGDLHNDNLMMTTKGLTVIDWESSCVGPLEWDAAQNVRYANPLLRGEQEQYWVSQGANLELLRFYFRVRSLSSLSHMVATGLKPPIYYQALQDLGWSQV